MKVTLEDVREAVTSFYADNPKKYETDLDEVCKSITSNIYFAYLGCSAVKQATASNNDSGIDYLDELNLYSIDPQWLFMFSRIMYAYGFVEGVVCAPRIMTKEMEREEGD